MSRFWHFALGLDEAADALWPGTQVVTKVPQKVTISASLAALTAYSGTPTPKRAVALWWLKRVDGFFLFWFGQDCHCADAALTALAELDPQVATEVGPKLKAFLDAAAGCGLETTL